MMLGKLSNLEENCLDPIGTAAEDMRKPMLSQNISEISAEIAIIATKCDKCWRKSWYQPFSGKEMVYDAWNQHVRYNAKFAWSNEKKYSPDLDPTNPRSSMTTPISTAPANAVANSTSLPALLPLHWRRAWRRKKSNLPENRKTNVQERAL
jgi:hypothetical protein